MAARLPDEKIAAIQALRAKGHSISEICSLTSSSRGSVHRLTLGIRLPSGPLKRGAKRKVSIRAVLQLHAQGLSLSAIAARIGCGRTAVHRILNARKAAA